MYLYYNQIHPLSSGDTILQVWHTNENGRQFFEHLGFTPLKVTDIDLYNQDYMLVLEEMLHPDISTKVKTI